MRSCVNDLSALRQRRSGPAGLPAGPLTFYPNSLKACAAQSGSATRCTYRIFAVAEALSLR